MQKEDPRVERKRGRKPKKGHLLHKLIHKSISVDRERERVLGFKQSTALQRERERERVLGIDRVAQRERERGF
jgi:hypothetical protein